jgi:hypothetical protein
MVAKSLSADIAAARQRSSEPHNATKIYLGNVPEPNGDAVTA